MDLTFQLVPEFDDLEFAIGPIKTHLQVFMKVVERGFKFIAASSATRAYHNSFADFCFG